MRFLTTTWLAPSRLSIGHGRDGWCGQKAPMYGGSFAELFRIVRSPKDGILVRLPPAFLLVTTVPIPTSSIWDGPCACRGSENAGSTLIEIAQAIAVCNPPRKEDRYTFLRDVAGILGPMYIAV